MSVSSGGQVGPGRAREQRAESREQRAETSDLGNGKRFPRAVEGVKPDSLAVVRLWGLAG